MSSIPQREDVQVIVVDDASDDMSELKFLTREAGCLELVFDKESKGAGHVRNVGLEYVRGEWIVFADADDFFEDGILSLLDRHYADKEDIVYFRAESIYSDTLVHSPKLDQRNRAIDRYASAPEKIRAFCSFFCTEPWGKMIRSSLVKEHGIRFDETPVANDYYFSVVAAFHAASIGFDGARMYVYTVRPESLSYKMCANESVLVTRLNVYLGVQHFYDEHKIPYIPFYEFVFSGLYRSDHASKDIVKHYLGEHGISVTRIWLRYLKGKLFQYTKGVHV